MAPSHSHDVTDATGRNWIRPASVTPSNIYLESSSHVSYTTDMTGGHCDANGQQNINFFVPGTPAPQGSKRHIGRGIMIESCKALAPWRERIALAAHNTTLGTPLMAGPLTVHLNFIMPRPKTTPKKTTPHAIKRPDLDKLARACLDAITNVIIKDDSQIVDLHATKRIANQEETPGVHITIQTPDNAA